MWDFYRGRSVLITGCTGFLAKAILEKLLRELGPSIGTVYVLIRKGTGKRSQDIHERLRNEVLGNSVFDRLRVDWGLEEFARLTEKCIVPVAGDLVAPKLGISDDMQQLIRENVTAILHCAAVVDFDERLDRSMAMNVTGTLELINLADSCAQMDAFVHVSTCYVNSHMQGQVAEQVYPFPFGDAARIYQNVLDVGEDAARLAAMTRQLRRVFPNTYTFTKNLTEQLILRSIERMRVREAEGGKRQWPIGLVRASIIGAAAVEPFPGWIDGLAAAGAGLVFAGLGMVHFFPGNDTNIADVVPVDHVSNVIIAAATQLRPPGTQFAPNCIAARENRKPAAEPGALYPPIYHAGVSSFRPVTWEHIGRMAVCYWGQCDPMPPRRITPPSLAFYSPLTFRFRFFVRYTLTARLLWAASKVTRKETWARNAEMYAKLTQSADAVTTAFAHFTTNSWIFRDDTVQQLARAIENDAKEPATPAIQLDIPRVMDWDHYLFNFNYGLHHYILGQRGLRTTPCPQGWTDLLQKIRVSVTDDPVSDAACSVIPAGTAGEQQHHLLQDADVLSALREAVSMAPANDTAMLAHYQSEAAAVRNAISRKLDRSLVDRVEPQLGQMLSSSFDSIRIDVQKVAEIKGWAQQGARLLYVLTSRSHMDYLLLLRLALKQGLPVPMFIASADQIPSGHPVYDAMAVCAPFRNSSKIHQAVFVSCVSAFLAGKGAALAICLEPTRTRTGRLDRVDRSHLLDCVIRKLAERGITDVKVVPISTTYDRLVEESSLLGIPRAECASEGPSAVSRPLKKAAHVPLSQLQTLTCGRAHIGVGDIMDAAHLCDPNTDESPAPLKASLIRQSQEKATVISPVHLAAAVLRAGRGQPIPYVRLIRTMAWLRDRVKAEGYWVDWQDAEDSMSVVLHSLRHLGLPHSISLDDERNLWTATVAVQGTPRALARIDYAASVVGRPLLGAAILATLTLARPARDVRARFDAVYRLLARVDAAGPIDAEFHHATQVLTKRGIMPPDTSTQAASSSSSYDHALLSSLVHPLLDAYRVTLAALSVLYHIPTLPRRALTQLAQVVGAWMAGEGQLLATRAVPREAVAAVLADVAAQGLVVPPARDADRGEVWYAVAQGEGVASVQACLSLLEIVGTPPQQDLHRRSVAQQLSVLWDDVVAGNPRGRADGGVTDALRTAVEQCLAGFVPVAAGNRHPSAVSARL